MSNFCEGGHDSSQGDFTDI